MTTKIYIVHALSPVHAGTGQATAAVDLPIARDRATRFPLIPGSTIKGVLRARARDANHSLSPTWTTIFGPETENASDHAGAVAFTDARLLLLPVRSVAGTFAWVTSPLLLSTLRRELKLVGDKLPDTPTIHNTQDAAIPSKSILQVDLHRAGPRVVLEELDLSFDMSATKLATKLGALLFPDNPEWQEMVLQRLCIVHDDVMSFLSEHSTEVVTRVHIDPMTGVAAHGQLWTEENLPAESVLFGLMEELPIPSVAPKDRGDHLTEIQSKLLNRPVQLGGKATVGRGRCSIRVTP